MKQQAYVINLSTNKMFVTDNALIWMMVKVLFNALSGLLAGFTLAGEVKHAINTVQYKTSLL